ncbi:MAG TPA: hydrogenase maturation protease [Spirochaetota bacterium]|nr:hydrogenase maturation protease [Spirochaetota bacterium]HQO39185.1 hydrogenase maturation protease [Spirochaetota bacterium]
MSLEAEEQSTAGVPAVKDVLVLGIGNILCMDEGVGVHLVNHIIESGRVFPENVEFADGGTSGYDLLPLMTGRRKIIIVDALKTDDVPGSIYRFPADSLVANNYVYSLHDLGVKKLVDMLKIMGENPEIEIIGIVPEDYSTLAIGMSDSVWESIPKAIAEVLKAVV